MRAAIVGMLSLSFAAHAVADATLRALARQFPAMPRETADLVPFVNGAPTFASGSPMNDLPYTILDTDYIDGENGGYDVFLPVDPSDPSPGSDTVKYIRCALNTDLDQVYGAAPGDRIILGTAEIPAPFFLRGPDVIDDDYAVIQHLDFIEPRVSLASHHASKDFATTFVQEQAKGDGGVHHQLRRKLPATHTQLPFFRKQPQDPLDREVPHD